LLSFASKSITDGKRARQRIRGLRTLMRLSAA
jgi:hypothetical protein